MTLICQELNGSLNCDFKRCREMGCKYHPFSMLFQLGLLGVASSNINNEADGVQEFKDSHSIDD